MHVVYLIALLGAIIPAGVYFFIATRFARRKPWWLLAMTFFWGAIPSTWMAGASNRFFNGVMMYETELGLSTPDQASAAIVILGVLSPLAEESLKSLLLLFVFLVFRKHFDGVKDGILFAAVVGWVFPFGKTTLISIARHRVRAFKLPWLSSSRVRLFLG